MPEIRHDLRKFEHCGELCLIPGVRPRTLRALDRLEKPGSGDDSKD